MAQAFVNSQPVPELFHILTATYDTPWLRDRSPIAVKQGSNVHWVLPHLDTPERPLDEQLFRNITKKTVETTVVALPQGNLVAGPRGRAVVLLKDEDDKSTWCKHLDTLAPLLGVSHWILAPAFNKEVTGHADVHVRFLSSRLAAVAWNEEETEDQERTEYLEARIREAVSSIEIMRLPLRSDGAHYASPLNWLQLGKHVLVPRYPITPARDVQITKQRLEQAGFRPRFIYSPTLEYAGSLHCLTASIYL